MACGGHIDTHASTRYVSMEDIEVLSVVTGEFIDAFHHGKEEKIHTLSN
jgi:hemerythrin-like domain-containing protein